MECLESLAGVWQLWRTMRYRRFEKVPVAGGGALGTAQGAETGQAAGSEALQSSRSLTRTVKILAAHHCPILFDVPAVASRRNEMTASKMCSSACVMRAVTRPSEQPVRGKDPVIKMRPVQLLVANIKMPLHGLEPCPRGKPESFIELVDKPCRVTLYLDLGIPSKSASLQSDCP